ncbi:MAG TPA: DUF6328 family protein [Actinomycetota bacterium]|nr:DUF6328 family protein [Actinomycetota bacterium]
MADKKSDIELEKFLQELRVMIPGVEVLFAFLLTVPFTERFAKVTDIQRGVYYIALVGAALSTAFLISPGIHHRLRWHEDASEKVMSTGNKLVITGILFLCVTVTSVLFVITDLLFGRPAASAAAGLAAAGLAGLWFVVPLIARARDGHT